MHISKNYIRQNNITMRIDRYYRSLMCICGQQASAYNYVCKR